MEGHNPTLREWVTERHKAAGDDPLLNDVTAARRDAFKEVLDWLEDNHVDVEPGFAQRYEAQMTRAGGIYADVVKALREHGHPAEVTQTGGMCLAITWLAVDESGDYFLLTDRDDVLSWDRHESQGWMLGRYGQEDEEPYVAEVSDLKHVETAVLMADAYDRTGGADAGE